MATASSISPPMHICIAMNMSELKFVSILR